MTVPGPHSAEGQPAAVHGLASILVPVYRNEAHLRDLYRRLIATLDPQWPDFELIFVNDGSPDASWSVIREICMKDKRVKGICLSRNFGQHPAISAALEHASGLYFVLMDADLQDHPEEIPRLLETLSGGDIDIVYTRKLFDDKPILLSFTSRLFHSVFGRVTGGQHTHNIGTFRGFNRVVRAALLQHPERAIVYGPLMHAFGFRTLVLDLPRSARSHSKSSYTFWMRLDLAVNVLMSYSTFPYKIMMSAGAILILCSFGYMVVVVIQKLFFGIGLPTGLTIIFVAQLLTLGLTLGAIGILGLYVFRVFREVLRRPRYLVQETINLADATSAQPSHSYLEHAETGL